MNANVDPELVKHVSKLSNDVEKMIFENQVDTKTLKMMINKVQLYLPEMEKRLEKIEHGQDILTKEQSFTSAKAVHLTSSLEVLEQKLIANQEVLQQEQISTSVKVDQLITNQDVLQQVQSSTTLKVEQLQSDQESVQNRVAELEIQKNRNVSQTFLYTCKYSMKIYF